MSGQKKRRKKRATVNSLPWELRGPGQNKYGGHQMQRLRGLRSAGGKHGPCVRVTDERRKEIEAEMRKRGEI
jgi:hypothetical protein